MAASRVFLLKLFLRGLEQPLVWSASKEDCERLTLDEEFFCFDNQLGTMVCVNTAYVEAAQVLSSQDFDFTLSDPPQGVRAAFYGRATPVEFSVDESMAMSELLQADEGAISWLDGNGGKVVLRLETVVYLEYPSEWESPED